MTENWQPKLEVSSDEDLIWGVETSSTCFGNFYVLLSCFHTIWSVITTSLASTIVDKSKSQFSFQKIIGHRNCDIFPVRWFFSTIFNAFYEQRLNSMLTVHAICKTHNYFVIVTHTLRLSGKNILSLKIVVIKLITSIITATIFVYKQTKHFLYCSVVQW